MSERIEIGVGDGSGIQVYVARPGDTVFLTLPDNMSNEQEDFQAMLDFLERRNVGCVILNLTWAV